MHRCSKFVKRVIMCYIVLSTLLVTIGGVAMLLDVVVAIARRGSSSAGATQAPYYEDKAWGDQFFDDAKAIESTKVVYTPFSVWRRPTFKSETINVDNSGRRLVPASSNASDALPVFFFGGSTMWGVSSPDWATIPNQVIELSQGSASQTMRAVNYGESAWVSTQSTIALIQALQRGEVPKLAIFYEGANDVLMGLINANAYQHADYSRIAGIFNSQDRNIGRGVRVPNPAKLISELLPNTIAQVDRKLASNASYALSDHDLEHLANQVIDVYCSNQDIVRALAERYGFEARFYWQPYLRNRKKLLTDREVELLKPKDEWSVLFQRFIPYIDARITRLQASDFLDLSSVFVHERQQIYTDTIHVTPSGNRLVASALIEDMTRRSPTFQGK